MTPEQFITLGIIPGMSLLPPEMDSPEARAMILAICLQESGLRQRIQSAGGPARSFAQGEKGGVIVAGVLSHHTSADLAKVVCKVLCYAPAPDDIYKAIEHNDALCVAFSRLALWARPEPLCGPDESEAAWLIYLHTWRPGKPRPETWAENYHVAWEAVKISTG